MLISIVQREEHIRQVNLGAQRENAEDKKYPILFQTVRRAVVRHHPHHHHVSPKLKRILKLTAIKRQLVRTLRPTAANPACEKVPVNKQWKVCKQRSAARARVAPPVLSAALQTATVATSPWVDSVAKYTRSASVHWCAPWSTCPAGCVFDFVRLIRIVISTRRRRDVDGRFDGRAILSSSLRRDDQSARRGSTACRVGQCPRESLCAAHTADSEYREYLGRDSRRTSSLQRPSFRVGYSTPRRPPRPTPSPFSSRSLAPDGGWVQKNSPPPYLSQVRCHDFNPLLRFVSLFANKIYRFTFLG